MDVLSSPRTGRHAPRSKNGCSTCRIRKVKCDEQRPLCSKCSNARISCEWDKVLPPRRTKKTSSPASSEASDSTGVVLYQTPPLETIEMPNSLVLSQQDLQSFQYAPESFMVLRFGKPWRWSTLSYLHSRVAPDNCGVMSAFIAVGAMELRFRDLIQYHGGVVSQSAVEQAARLRGLAAKYFNVAIKQLSTLLDRVSRNDPTEEDIEILFAMWFLILHGELYDPDLIGVSQIHLNGIRSFIVRYMQENSRKLPASSNQLLLFISYHDANLALGDLNGGQLCLDLMAIPNESPLAYDRIWQAARIGGPKIWGDEYPAEAILDDIENYRGLSFLHACQRLKLSIWRIAVDVGRGNFDDESIQRLWDKIEGIGEEYSDLLALAKCSTGSGGRRVMWTIYHGGLDYYAIKVLYGCLDEHETAPQWLETALAELLSIAHKALGEDPRQLYRFSWSLAVALLKVRDPIHRDWIQVQLRKARVLLSDVGLPAHLIDRQEPPKNVFLEYRTNNLIGD